MLHLVVDPPSGTGGPRPTLRIGPRSNSSSALQPSPQVKPRSSSRPHAVTPLRSALRTTAPLTAPVTACLRTSKLLSLLKP
uniref:Uncharacterized protein n=1 Tax=Arundo donax TaxID=35708 RepID=A0A0A8YYL2_ARUDO